MKRGSSNRRVPPGYWSMVGWVLALGSTACSVDERTFSGRSTGGVLGNSPAGSGGAGNGGGASNDAPVGRASEDGLGNGGASNGGASNSVGSGGASNSVGSGGAGNAVGGSAGNELPEPTTSGGGPGAGGNGAVEPSEPPLPLSRSLRVTLLGSGSVTSSPAGIDCPGVCTAIFEDGAVVTLTGAPVEGSADYFEGWGGACSGFESCTLTIAGDTAVSASFGPANLVFVTSSTVLPGQLGGLPGADQLCQEHAAAAGLSGRYVAWLATPTIRAFDRLSGARGWVRPDGLAVADSSQGLSEFEMFYPIRLDEFGDDSPDLFVATGTGGDDLSSTGSDCGEWTDPTQTFIFGSTSALGLPFTTNGGGRCDSRAALYCFGVDRQVRVEPQRATGRMAFVSQAGFSPGGGISAADALCQAEAVAAGLGGTFRAELATATAPPQARFNLARGPWVRPDGVLLAATATEYFVSPFSLSAPSVTASGEYIDTARNWLGLTNEFTSSAETTCSNWTSPNLMTGIVSTVGTTSNPGSALFGSACSFTAPVICLEE